MTTQIPADLIPAINRVIRASQKLLGEIGRQPSQEELAIRLAMPVAKVERLLAIGRGPIGLATLTVPSQSV
jgi:RNA polymerase primary sigma factor